MKAKYLLLVFFFFIAVGNVSAQIYFNRNYGDTSYFQEYATGIVNGDNGEYFVTGFSADTTNHFSIWVLIIDSAGNTLISKKYGKQGKSIYPNIHSLIRTSSSEYVLTGYDIESFNTNTNQCNLLLAKFNENGDTILFRKIPYRFYTYGSAIIELRDHFHYAMTGNTTDSNSYGDIFLMKTDTSGNVIFKKSYGTVNNDVGNDVIECYDGGFLITGKYNYNVLTTRYYSAFLLKTDSLGNQEWFIPFYPQPNYLGSVASSVIQLPDSNYLVCGTVLDSNQIEKAFIVKCNQVGNKIWEKIYRIKTNCGLVSKAVIDPNGGYIFAGVAGGTGYDFGGWIIKVDENGDSLWSRTYLGQPIFGELSDLKLCNDGGYITCGYNNHCCGFGHQDFWVVKMDSLGCDSLGCVSTYNDVPIIEGQIVGLNLYPNPATNLFHLVLDKNIIPSKSVGEVSIFNVMGEKVYTDVITGNEKTINCHLPAGVYFVRVKDEGRISTGKVVIE